MAGLLFPAYQKFYSALCSLERFDKERDFFNNISSLDNFFTEYRNITFVMKKSLAHTSFLDIYEKNVNIFLNDKWFVNKRNEITKEHPFQLIKKIHLTVYFPNTSVEILSEEFSVENDVKLNTLIDSIKEVLVKINPYEVFFSVKYAFSEVNGEKDVLEKCIKGIHTMEKFMNTMYEDIGESCPLCDKLIKKISESILLYIPQDMLLIDDFAYYPNKNEFDRADRMVTIFEKEIDDVKATLSNLDDIFKDFDYNYFQRFVLMNACIQSTNLMPTIMTVYNDNTFDFNMFSSSIKTTFYRKINETANRILLEDIKEIYYMTTYICLSYLPSYLKMTSKERAVYSNKELLVFIKVDSNLNEEEYSFDEQELKDPLKVINILNYRKKGLYYGKSNMLPIIEAFRKKKMKR